MAFAVSGSVPRATLGQRLNRAYQSSGKGLKRVRHVAGEYCKRLWCGKTNEKEKIVLQKGLARALLRCMIHLLPVSVTITMAYLNLAGRFIGSNLQGLTGGVYQAIDVLCLQVTAKLQVIMF